MARYWSYVKSSILSGITVKGEIVASWIIISWCRPGKLSYNWKVWFLVG